MKKQQTHKLEKGDIVECKSIVNGWSNIGDKYELIKVKKSNIKLTDLNKLLREEDKSILKLIYKLRSELKHKINDRFIFKNTINNLEFNISRGVLIKHFKIN